MQNFMDALRERFAPEDIRQNEPMDAHTTFRVGGPADIMVFPREEAQLLAALEAARAAGVPALVMGNGSNLLVRAGGIRGLVVVLDGRFGRIRREGCVLTAQAGAALAGLSAYAMREGLSGLEFAAGIPGTVGGGVAMNAGAYGGELADTLLWARVLLGGEARTLGREEMQMGYRSTRALREGGVVLEAAFSLKAGDAREIGDKMSELNARRREKQPLNLPSAGSTFKRPEGYFAGALIEEAGLKGARVGGAQVSQKHAGFIVNAGGASSDDVIALIEYVRARVLEHSGVSLECEVRIVGEDRLSPPRF